MDVWGCGGVDWAVDSKVECRMLEWLAIDRGGPAK